MVENPTQNVASGTGKKGRLSMSSDSIIGLGCGLAILIILLLTNPFLECGLYDDWAYSYTAMVLSRSGHLVFNGWTTAMFGMQAWWGAALIKMFGFSFTILRFSTIIITSACAVLIYHLGRRIGLLKPLALFAVFSILLMPMCVVNAVSYMTDLPGLFLNLVIFFLFARAIESKNSAQSAMFIITATILCVLGGTVRQTIWFMLVFLVPYVAYYKRKDVAIIITTTLCWIIGLIAISKISSWFSHQPYSISENLHPKEMIRLISQRLRELVGILYGWKVSYNPLRVFSTGFEQVLPVTLLMLTRLRIWRYRSLSAAVVLLALQLTLYCMLTSEHMWPFWLEVNYQGFALPGAFTQQPDVLSWPVRVLVVLGVAVTAVSILTEMAYLNRLRRNKLVSKIWVAGLVATSAVFTVEPALIRTSLGDKIAFTSGVLFLLLITLCVVRQVRDNNLVSVEDAKTDSDLSRITNYPVFLRVCWAYSIPYIIIVIGRFFISTDPSLFDRYFIPIMPVVTYCTLLYLQRAGLQRAPLFAWLLAIACGYFGVSASHDYMAAERTRVALATSLVAKGVPRTQIMAGFEYDGWTQLEQTGFVMDPRTKELSGDSKLKGWRDNFLHYNFRDHIPDVKPRYLILNQHQEFLPDVMPPVQYTAFLYPFRRNVYVQELKNPEEQLPASGDAERYLLMRQTKSK